MKFWTLAEQLCIRTHLINLWLTFRFFFIGVPQWNMRMDAINFWILIKDNFGVIWQNSMNFNDCQLWREKWFGLFLLFFCCCSMLATFFRLIWLDIYLVQVLFLKVENFETSPWIHAIYGALFRFKQYIRSWIIWRKIMIHKNKNVIFEKWKKFDSLQLWCLLRYKNMFYLFENLQSRSV